MPSALDVQISELIEECASLQHYIERLEHEYNFASFKLDETQPEWGHGFRSMKTYYRKVVHAARESIDELHIDRSFRLARLEMLKRRKRDGGDVELVYPTSLGPSAPSV